MARPVSNPPNPWLSTSVEYLGPPPDARLEVYEERARTVLSKNSSPDVPFRWSLNPYRGCQHACAYCYARPSHQYLSWGAGTDFDKKIVVKTNAPELLRAELGRRSWKGEPITFSGITDCYQPLEACYRLTRGCLEACLERRNPVVVITKASLVRRDADLLAELERCAGARVFLSIPFADAETARRIEPGAPSPSDRFETLRNLAAAGVPTGVALAPLVPGLNESDVPRILARARAAGATHAFLTLLRLPAEVLPVFRTRLEEALPHRARHVFAALSDVRAGRLGESRFAHRMRGRGPRWEATRRLFELQCRRLGLAVGDGGGLRPMLSSSATARRQTSRQTLLFEETP